MFKKQIIQLICLSFFNISVIAETDSAIGHSMTFWYEQPYPANQHGQINENIRLLGAVRIKAQYKEHEITGLSGLAWDKDEQLLYAISDNGKLFHLKPTFHNNTLHQVNFVRAFDLLDENGEKLKSKIVRDSEGLTADYERNSIKDDTELIISFERTPRVIRYNTRGNYLGKIQIPAYLENIKNYRGPNSALESIAFNSQKELTLIPERQLKQDKKDTISVYHNDKKTEELPLSNPDISGITAIEYIDDKNLLILERSFRMRIFPQIEIRLKKWNLIDNSLKTLATFKNNGEFQVDNFEGLTHYKNNQFFIISDDNANSYQQTILLLFEITE